MKPLPIFTKRFYGWYVLAGAFVVLFFNAICYSMLGIALKPISADLGWPEASMSTIVFTYMIIHAVSVSLGGKVYDHFGPKTAIILFSVFILIGNIMVAFTQSFWFFNVAFGVFVGIGMGGPSSPLMGAIIAKWFKKYRGLAISLAVAGFCLGLFTLIPVANYFVNMFDWRPVFIAVGIVLFVINTTIALFVIKGDPKDFGLKALGTDEAVKAGVNTKAFDAAHDISLTTALRTKGFWCMLTVMTVCGVGCTYMAMYFIASAVDSGITALTAGAVAGSVGIYSIVGMLIAGPMADKTGGKWPLAVCMLLRAVGFGAVLYAQTFLSFNALAILMGLTYMATLPISNTVAANMFGTSHIGVITGIFTTGHHAGGAILAIFVGMMLKLTGGYHEIFIIVFVICIIGVVAAMLIKEKRYYVENGIVTQET